MNDVCTPLIHWLTISLAFWLVFLCESSGEIVINAILGKKFRWVMKNLYFSKQKIDHSLDHLWFFACYLNVDLWWEALVTVTGHHLALFRRPSWWTGSALMRTMRVVVYAFVSCTSLSWKFTSLVSELHIYSQTIVSCKEASLLKVRASRALRRHKKSWNLGIKHDLSSRWKNCFKVSPRPTFLSVMYMLLCVEPYSPNPYSEVLICICSKYNWT